jgi:hypothetical protein
MKKMNFKCLVVLCMALGFATVAKAQIGYSSTDYFYTEIGETASSLRYAVKFRSDAVWLKEVSYSKARENLSKNALFYENEEWTDKGTESYYIWGQGVYGECDRKFTYCPSLSTSTRIVYKRHVEYSYYHPLNGVMNATAGYGCVKTTSDGFGGGKTFYYNYDMYVAFSPDKSSFIFWKEKSYNPDGKIDGKQTYTMVPKSELLPKAANHDFLND